MNKVYRNLEDLCQVLDSKRIPITANKRTPGPYPYYGANGVQDYINEYIFDDDLVLLAEDGGNFGSTDKPIAYRVSGKCWVNNHAHVLKPNNEINVDYLCYSLMFYNTGSLVNGATRKKLTQATMRTMRIPWVPIVEQIEIVDKLKKTAAIIDKKELILRRLDQLIKSRFIELFGDPVSNGKFWNLAILQDVTSKIGSGATPKGGKSSYQKEGIPFIRSMNVHDGVFLSKDLAYLSDKQAKQLENVIVKENDVLLNITGASVARSCIVPKTVIPARVNQHVSIIRCIPKYLNPEFLNKLFLHHRYKNLLLSLGEAGGATRQAITKSQLEKLQIILPPLTLQNEFADFVQQVDKSKLAVQKSLEKLEILKKSLMQQYFG